LNEKQLKLESRLKEEVNRKRKLASSNPILQNSGGNESLLDSKSKLIDKYMLFSLHPQTLNLTKYMYKGDRV